MNEQERTLLHAIMKDCKRLERRGELTEFGRGQLVLAELLLGPIG